MVTKRFPELLLRQNETIKVLRQLYKPVYAKKKTLRASQDTNAYYRNFKSDAQIKSITDHIQIVQSYLGPSSAISNLDLAIEVVILTNDLLFTIL